MTFDNWPLAISILILIVFACKIIADLVKGYKLTTRWKRADPKTKVELWLYLATVDGTYKTLFRATTLGELREQEFPKLVLKETDSEKGLAFCFDYWHQPFFRVPDFVLELDKVEETLKEYLTVPLEELQSSVKKGNFLWIC